MHFAITETPSHYDEYLGARKKSWVTLDNGVQWLFKQARPDVPGEAWAEKITAEIARLLGINHAVIELAMEKEQGLGIVSPSFMPAGGMLFHGNDILYAGVPDYDRELRRGQRRHTVMNVIRSVDVLARSSDNAAVNVEQILDGLASYLILDGLIGNTDRHHGNWGLIYNRVKRTYDLAPTFDHGSSLGRDLSDAERQNRLNHKGGVIDYVMRGEGQVFVDEHRKVGPSPLQLAQMVCLLQPDRVRVTLDRLRNTSDREFRGIINLVPQSVMSTTAKKFAHQMVVASKNALLKGSS